jgi:4'-phosphopantetheinyl transferase
MPPSTPDSIWNRPPASLQLGAGEVHVWRACLMEHLPRVAALGNLLSADEHVAAARFRFASDRERYVLARGLLREILHRYLAVVPDQLQFSYGPHGKPALAVPTAGGGLRFNLSHAHEVALYAVSRDQEVGIDVERLRSDIEYEQIARHVFSPREVTALHALPPPLRVEAFFRCWTIKEAYVKGHGGGLSIPLDQFDVEFTPGAPPALLATRPDVSEASHWTIALLDLQPGYTAALAVAGPLVRLTCWQVEAERRLSDPHS